MTTPDDPAGAVPPAAAPAAPRPKRRAPTRDKPQRSYAPGRDEGPAPVLDATASEAVARVVRLGYEVIGQNIEQGREAALRFRAGAYSAREAPQDLGRLAARMLNLARELSTTTFDVLERLVQDPGFVAAARTPQPSGPAAGAPDQPSPAPFHPGAPPAPPAASGAPGNGDATASPPPGPQSLELTCSFTGRPGAVVKAATLSRPERPAYLLLPSLTAVEPDRPPIIGASFTPAETGDGVVAHISIRQEQPPGVYSGVILAYDTHVALGLLTIEVLP